MPVATESYWPQICVERSWATGVGVARTAEVEKRKGRTACVNFMVIDCCKDCWLVRETND